MGAGEGHRKALVRTKIKWGGVDVPSNNVVICSWLKEVGILMYVVDEKDCASWL